MSAKYKRLVKKAREYLTTIDNNKLKVAEIALQACTIQVGGHNKAALYTLKKFSEDIGMNRKTLTNWVQYYKIHSVVEESGVDINSKVSMSAIRDILRTSQRDKRSKGFFDNPKEIIAAFKEAKKRGPEDIAMETYAKRMGNVLFAVNSYVLDELDQTSLVAIKDIAAKIDKKLADHFRKSTRRAG